MSTTIDNEQRARMAEEETQRLLFEKTKSELLALLQKHHIPIDQWGQGSAKTIDHLTREILAGETTLENGPAGELVRKVSIACVDVFHQPASGERLKLTEDRQVFKDGRERRRTIETSIAEKLKPNEIPNEETVNRALQEELGITSAVPAAYTRQSEQTQISPSYPGLTMQAIKHFFAVELGDDTFKPEGYVEHQADKDTYFVWTKDIAETSKDK